MAQATRAEFASLAETEGWPDDWFSCAASGGEPWVFYMSEVLSERCFEVLDKALDGAGHHIREQCRELGWKEEVIETAPETKTE